MQLYVLPVYSDEDESLFAPLTQRLVSALIEENIMAPLEDTALAELAASGKGQY